MADEFQYLKAGLHDVIKDSKERSYSEIVILATVIIVLIKADDKTNLPEFNVIKDSTEPFDEFILTKITSKIITVNTIDFDIVTDFFELAQMFYQTMFDVKTEDTEVKDTITKIKDEFKNRTNPLITQIYLGHLKSSIVPAAVSSEIKKKIDARCKTVKYLEQVEMQEFKEIPDLKQNIITKIGMKEQLCIILVDAEKYSEEILEAVPFQYFYLVIYGKDALQKFCNPLGTVPSNSTSTEFVNKIKELQGINEKLLDVYILDESITVTPSVTPSAVEVIHYLPNAYSKYTIKFNATDKRIMLQDDNAKEYIILELMHLFLTDNGGVKKAKEEAKNALVAKEEAVQADALLSKVFVEEITGRYYYNDNKTLHDAYNLLFSIGKITVPKVIEIITRFLLTGKRIERPVYAVDFSSKSEVKKTYVEMLTDLNFDTNLTEIINTTEYNKPECQTFCRVTLKSLLDELFTEMSKNETLFANICNELIAYVSIDTAFNSQNSTTYAVGQSGTGIDLSTDKQIPKIIEEFKKKNPTLCNLNSAGDACETNVDNFTYKIMFQIINSISGVQNKLLSMINKIFSSVDLNTMLGLKYKKCKVLLDDGEYEGDFVNEMIKGQGTYTYSTGDKYEGDVSFNFKLHGKGKYTYANGYVYEGDIVDKLGHGKGTLRLSNGTVYTGEFNENLREGTGKQTWANGNIYEGLWSNDKFAPNGGHFTYNNDTKYYDTNFNSTTNYLKLIETINGGSSSVVSKEGEFNLDTGEFLVT